MVSDTPSDRRTPRAASTVVLLRDTSDGLETFLLRRVSTMKFAPRMHVFPGGRVDEIDYSVAVNFSGGDAQQLAARASTDEAGIRALYHCAVRETEEEAGITLAPPSADGRIDVDVRSLPLIDHWVTPEVEKYRYDVRFFAALVPGGRAHLTTTEADVALWITAESAVTQFEAGELPMLPPTEAVLRSLLPYRRAQDVIDDAHTRTIVPILPQRITASNGSQRWVLRHDRTGELLEGKP